MESSVPTTGETGGSSNKNSATPAKGQDNAASNLTSPPKACTGQAVSTPRGSGPGTDTLRTPGGTVLTLEERDNGSTPTWGGVMDSELRKTLNKKYASIPSVEQDPMY